MLMGSGGTPAFSGLVRLMQRPELMQRTEVGGGGARDYRGVARRKMETRRRGGKVKTRTPLPINKAMIRWHVRESRRPKNGYEAMRTPRFSGYPLRQKFVEIYWALCEVNA